MALMAYAQGYFPMAESIDEPHCVWVRPKKRGMIPLDQFHVASKLAQKFRNMQGQLFYDRDFEQVLKNCQTIRKDKTDTWINDEIVDLYLELHEEGHAHSVEYWENDQLLGGLYGLHIGGIFFGESMFSRATNASKFCLIQLVATLIQNKFKILDAQFINDHLSQFGAIEIDQIDFEPLLEEAIKLNCNFIGLPNAPINALNIIAKYKT